MLALVKEKGINYLGNITTPSEISALMNDTFHLSEVCEEYAYLLCFDFRFGLLGIFEISHGSMSTTMMGTREIFKRALL